MNVVVITSREGTYQYHLCAELARRHNVVAVLHPRRRTQGWPERRASVRRKIRRYGWAHVLIAAGIRNRVYHVGWNLREDVARAERRFFPDAWAHYRTHVADRAQDVPDINSPAGVALLASFEPDAVVCSGGPIYGAALIEVAGTMLNYHTGISPIYNGAYTIFWTYANGQPELSGGTLMRMSTVVDGGDVLAHYLPSVEQDDTPGSLFMKAIQGGVELYDRVLTDLAAGRSILAVPQGPPFRHYLAYEWTAYQTLAVERFIRTRICRSRTRPAASFEYWNESSPAAAREKMRRLLLTLVHRG